MLSFKSKSDSISSLKYLFSRYDFIEVGSIFRDFSIRDFYKVFVLAGMYYPTQPEFDQVVDRMLIDSSICLNYLKRALENVESGRINFIDPKIGLFDLTETLYTSHSNGRTKVTRMLFRSNPTMLLGFIWLHQSGRISIIQESDKRNLEAMNLDRSAFGSTASGIKFQINSNLMTKIIKSVVRSKTFTYISGKRIVPNYYNAIARLFLRIFRMEVLERNENFVPIFYNQIFMNDYADWNQSTLSRIKVLVDTSEVALYMTLHDDIVYRSPYFFSDKRKSEFLSVLDLARVASKIFVPSRSEYTNMNHHFANKSNVLVVPWSGDHILQFNTPKVDSESIERDTFLHFLGADPRKNSIRVFQAMLMMARKGAVFSLNIVGSLSSGEVMLSSLIADLQSLGIELNFYTNINEEQLAKLYSTSGCLIYCSLAEGFGLPIAEAAEMGCSVITSNFGSMLEVGSKYDRVSFINPTDVRSMEEAMTRFLAEDKFLAPIEHTNRRTWDDVFRDILVAMGRTIL